MINSRVKKLWGREFDLVEEGLDESQVVDFVEEFIQQRDACLEENKSLLSCIKLIKEVIRQVERLPSSGGRQAKSKVARTATKVEQDTQSEVGAIELEQDTQSEVGAIELEQAAPSASLETARVDETIGEKEMALYQGELELAIPPPIDAAELLQFERELRNSFPLRILGTEGSPSKGSLIIVFLGEPQPLVHSLKQIPEVKDAAEELDIPSEVKGMLMPRFKNGHRKRIWLTIGKKEQEEESA